MAHFLNASELAELCTELELETELTILEAAAANAGAAIARKLGVAVVVEASTEPGFAGLCVGFGSATPGQKCPEALAAYDSGSDWAQGEE